MNNINKTLDNSIQAGNGLGQTGQQPKSRPRTRLIPRALLAAVLCVGNVSAPMKANAQAQVAVAGAVVGGFLLEHYIGRLWSQYVDPYVDLYMYALLYGYGDASYPNDPTVPAATGQNGVPDENSDGGVAP